MATELRFTVPGKPQPKQRARKGKGGTWYTPQATRDYEAHVRQLAVIATMAARRGDSHRYDTVPEADRWPRGYDGDVSVELAVFWPDRRRRDADNVAKAVLDGMHSHKRRGAGVIADDSQVRDLRVTTSVDREAPRVEVVVRMLTSAPGET